MLVAWAMALGGSILLGYGVAQFAPEAAKPDFGDAAPSIVFTLIVLVSPVVETVLMGLILLLYARFLGSWRAVLASAATWGVLHSLSAATWGLVIWWPFLIFSILFLTWRHRGFWFASLIVATVHLCQNVGPAIAIVTHR